MRQVVVTTAAKSNDARVDAVFVGRPGELTASNGSSWRTALYKERVDGPVYLDLLNLAGDAQADLVHHGGLDKAVCVYPGEHYPYWAQRLGHRLPQGAFGENFAIYGLTEATVCLGDVYTIGDAVVQVTQPRSPCYKIARRWHRSLALWFQETGYTGWYMRVLQPGLVESGQQLRLTDRGHGRWTIARLNQIRYQSGAGATLQELQELSNCADLTTGWRARIQSLIAGEPTADDESRLEGPS